MAKKIIELPIEWDINEKERFKEIIQSIKKRSPFLAQRIKDDVKKNLSIIKKNPLIFEADELKIDNDKSYRKFNVIHVRFIYKIDTDKIIIARVRYSASEPVEY